MKTKKNNDENLAVRAMPYSQEAEQCVLGACLTQGELVVDVSAKLRITDFYLKPHKKIYEAILSLYADNKAVDVVTVNDILNRSGFLADVGGLDYLVRLSEILPGTANYGYYVLIVKRDSILRSLIKAANAISDVAYVSDDENDAMSKAEKLIFDLSRERDVSSIVNVNTVTSQTIKEIEDLLNGRVNERAIKSGFKNFDMFFNGLHRSDLILIAARPGVGKTSFALNIVSNVALREKKKVVVFSLEMPIEQLAKRLLCGVGHVNMSDVSSGNVAGGTFMKLHAANKEITSSEIYVDDSSFNTPADILSKCRRFIKEHGGLDLVMIDYLQLMSVGKRIENRQQEVSELTRALKIAAKELKVPILLLSQLSRALETRSDHRPMLSDLRESGAIEQDADIVIFIHKPDLYDVNAPKDEVEMIVSKHRNGRTGSLYFEWVGEEVSFRPKLDRTGDAAAVQNKKGVTNAQTLSPEPPPPEELFSELNSSAAADIDAFGVDYKLPEV